MQTDTAGLSGPPQPETQVGGNEASAGKMARGIARGALIVAVLTALSRVLGLLRTVVFAQTIGAGCLGTAYVTANQVPNLIVELAIGGALSSAMVPVLARSANLAATDPREKRKVEQISSALLTWSIVILLPVSVAIAAAAGPISALLNPANPNSGCSHPDMINAASFMLISFAPQILLYGFSVVLFGLLQAYRKFTATSLAPVIGNVVVISAYLVFASLDHNASLTQTPLTAMLVLSVGTTMNIGMLVFVAIPSTWRLHLRWRLTLKFPPGVLRRASGLALVGALEFVAADVYSVVTIDLANGHGNTGALVLSNYGNLVFSAICSVLPLAVVVATFPVLSSSDGDAFDRTSAGSNRAVMLMSCLSTAIMITVALPAAHVLTHRPGQIDPLIQSFLLYAPGVAGFAVVTNLSRVLFALGKLKAAGIILVAQQLLPAVLSVPLVLLAPPRLAVGALALASSAGLLAVSVPAVIAVRRLRGPAAIAGFGHAALAGIAAAGAGAAAGLLVALALPTGRSVFEVGAGFVATIVAIGVFGVVAYALDQGDTRVAFGRLRRLVRIRR
ncbi:MAG TPA: lipid II flippase MurJ [Trebonia sp.]|nr:lipid II flippase MurJ [Trebonia sp.]